MEYAVEREEEQTSKKEPNTDLQTASSKQKCIA